MKQARLKKLTGIFMGLIVLVLLAGAIPPSLQTPVQEFITSSGGLFSGPESLVSSEKPGSSAFEGQESGGGESSSSFIEKEESSKEASSSDKKGETGSDKTENSSSAGGSSPSKPSESAGGAASKPSSSTPAAPPSSSPSLPAPSVTPSGKIVVGYYGGWSSYKGYTMDKVPAGNLTHLNYAFAKIDPQTKKIALATPANDLNNFKAMRRLKQNNPHLKTLISVGGWDYSTYFSDIAATAANREIFAKSCVDFIVEHGFDGVDLDWEYPVSGGLAGNTNRPQDKQNFTSLLRAIREKLNAQGSRDGRKYYLTIAGAANTSYLGKIQPQSVAALVDHIFVMTYDMHGPWDKYSDLLSPLYQPKESSPQYKNSVNDAISAYRSSGVPAGRLVLGMPFYGYLYSGVDSKNNGLYSSFSSAKSITFDAVRASYLNNQKFTKLRHSDAKVPYLYGNKTFITYEDAQSIADKAKLAKSRGLGGVGAWELSQDTSGTLLKSARNALYY